MSVWSYYNGVKASILGHEHGMHYDILTMGMWKLYCPSYGGWRFRIENTVHPNFIISVGNTRSDITGYIFDVEEKKFIYNAKKYATKDKKLLLKIEDLEKIIDEKN
jgi:hypothetical protein